jgi:hypothetical protein
MDVVEIRSPANEIWQIRSDDGEPEYYSRYCEHDMTISHSVPRPKNNACTEFQLNSGYTTYDKEQTADINK